MPKCVVCERDVPVVSCEVITLTQEEKDFYGDLAQDDVLYCKPCWRVLSNPITGPTLMSGILRHILIARGVENPEERAQEYRSKLIAKATRKVE